MNITFLDASDVHIGISGSLQHCPGIPDDLKAVFRTMWDLDPVDLIDMAADRAPFIDQSQSLTLGIQRPTPELMVGISLTLASIYRPRLTDLTCAL